MLGRRIVRPLGVAAVALALLAVPGLQATAQAKAPEAPTQLRAVPQENPIDPKQPLMRLRWTSSMRISQSRVSRGSMTSCAV